ncbi:MAG TPA: leucyl/phenylalanyl-tRNA--protein transferase [Acidimicrobiia bacterium]|nr:leucyl/phenylalanyl-tRNA--protein transferase [Acidimicrobiia bacterium]
MPDPHDADGDLVAVGGDLEPGTLLDAYRRGFFPMRIEAGGPIGWWSPDPRGVIPLDGFHAARSLRRSARRYNVTVDAAFPDVVAGCADPSRPHGWIDDSFRAAYARLHELGWAHSVEVWTVDGSAPRLAGGLYGVAIGGLFAGESMFHSSRDASKVALLTLVEALPAAGGVLLDVQWCTPHLESLGAVAVPRDEYLRQLDAAVRRTALRL